MAVSQRTSSGLTRLTAARLRGTKENTVTPAMMRTKAAISSQPTFPQDIAADKDPAPSAPAPMPPTGGLYIVIPFPCYFSQPGYAQEI
jgi:hypothetical protein